jgi:cobalt/nickel transport system ATP-binding protein
MLMEFDHVSFTYPCNLDPSIAGLSLQLPEGKRFAFIGRNGCGKTTLFRLANGLYRPQQGTINWQGEPLTASRQRALRQQVGLVFQDPDQQLVATTVEEDISYGLFNLGLPEAEVARRVEQALVAFDLTDLADAPINYLSLGQKKRVSIVDVMVLQPKLLLLDEPTAYLDPAQVRNLWQMLHRIHQAGTTVAIATHDLDFAYAWADWIFVMEAGRLVLEGSPNEVFSQANRLESLGLGQPPTLQVAEGLLAAIAPHISPETLLKLRHEVCLTPKFSR